METVTVTREQAASIAANPALDAAIRAIATKVVAWIDGETLKPVSVELDFGSPEFNASAFAALA